MNFINIHPRVMSLDTSDSQVVASIYSTESMFDCNNHSSHSILEYPVGQCVNALVKREPETHFSNISCRIMMIIISYNVYVRLLGPAMLSLIVQCDTAGAPSFKVSNPTWCSWQIRLFISISAQSISIQTLVNAKDWKRS